MRDEKKASPRPWKRGIGGMAEFIIAVGDGTKPTLTVAELWYGTLSRDERNANADLIVRAVNAFDELVRACQLARTELARITGEPGFEPERYRERLLASWRLDLALRGAKAIEEDSAA